MQLPYRTQYIVVQSASTSKYGGYAIRKPYIMMLFRVRRGNFMREPQPSALRSPRGSSPCTRVPDDTRENLGGRATVLVTRTQ